MGLELLLGSFYLTPDAVAALLGGLTVLVLHLRTATSWPAAVAALAGVTLAAQTLGLLCNLDTNSTFGIYTVPTRTRLSPLEPNHGPAGKLPRPSGTLPECDSPGM